MGRTRNGGRSKIWNLAAAARRGFIGEIEKKCAHQKPPVLNP